MDSSKKSVIKKLQLVGASKPYRGFAHLSMGYHEIVGFRVVKNKFNETKQDDKRSKSILVELQNEVVFLPQYFLDKIDEDDIAELNSADTENMFLYFGGRRNGKK